MKLPKEFFLFAFFKNLNLMRNKIIRFLLINFILLVNQLVAYADPKPGDIFKEYYYVNYFNFVKEGTEIFDSVATEIFIDDIDKAISFEVGISIYWPYRYEQPAF